MIKINDSSNVVDMIDTELPVKLKQEYSANTIEAYARLVSPQGLQNILDIYETKLNQFLRRKSTSDNIPEIKIVFRSAKEDGTSYFLRTNKSSKPMIDVYADIYVDGVLDTIASEKPVLKLPGINKFGVLYIKGAPKVHENVMVPSESITAKGKHDNKIFTLTFKKGYSAKVKILKDDVQLYTGKKMISLVDYARYIVEKHWTEKGFNREMMNLGTVIKNAELQSMLTKKRESLTTLEDKIVKNNVPNTLKSSSYMLGDLREVMTDMLSLDRAIGKVTATSVINPNNTSEVLVPKGETISDSSIRLMKSHGVKMVNIKYKPEVSNSKLADNVTVDTCPEGTIITNNLRRSFNIPKDIVVADKEYKGRFALYKGENITEEELEDLYNLGVSSIMLSVADRPYKCEFVRTIVSTGCEYVNTGEGRVIKYKPTYGEEDADLNYITPDDIIAILSYALDYSVGLVTPPDIDKDFLKKIYLIDTSITRVVDTVTSNLILGNSSIISNWKKDIINRIQSSRWDGMFTTISMEVEKYLISDKGPLKDPDDINPVALLSQINRVVVDQHSSKEASNDQRIVPMMYNGIIDPYETSAGKKIGLNNTLASLVKIDGEGKARVPYLKVLHVRDGIKLDNKVTYLSINETRYQRIGDLSSVTIDKNGYLNPMEPTIARVPSNTGEMQSIETIPVGELNYVNADPHQHCGSTLQLIPFAGANDAARDLFSLNLLRQSIQLRDAEVPIVTTPTYSDVFNYSDSYVHRYEHDYPGVVRKIKRNAVEVIVEDGDLIDVTFGEVYVTSQFYTLMNIRVKVGDKVYPGDIIADSNMALDGEFSPGVHGIVAYMPFRGKNYEDAIPVSESFASKFTSVSIEREKVQIDKEASIDPLTQVSYVTQGDVLTKFTSTRNVTPQEVKMRSLKAGLLIDQKYSRDKGEYRAITLAFNHLKNGDKMAGRHGDKGIESMIFPDDEVPQFKNGVPVDIFRNPFGIASRMNIGQQMESQLGFVGYLLNLRFNTPAFNGASLSEIAMLVEMLYDFCNNKHEAVRSKWEGKVPSAILDRAKEREDILHEWEGCFDKNGDAELYNPVTETYYENKITFGYFYVLKIEHEVNHKIHSRAGAPVEDARYTKVHYQPPKGSNKGGGQSTGEMEAATIIAHGAVNFYDELANELSDNLARRTNLATELLKQDNYYSNEYIQKSRPRAVENLVAYLYALGIELQDEHEEPIIDSKYAKNALVIDNRVIAKHEALALARNREEAKEENISKETQELLELVRGLYGEESN